ncbi:hypothetical protein KY285_007650 [Solanum tuberosum]|nr:hypothetical protein KY285_007650 [Solanum tuberosum]
MVGGHQPSKLERSAPTQPRETILSWRGSAPTLGSWRESSNTTKKNISSVGEEVLQHLEVGEKVLQHNQKKNINEN